MKPFTKESWLEYKKHVEELNEKAWDEFYKDEEDYKKRNPKHARFVILQPPLQICTTFEGYMDFCFGDKE